MEDSKSSSPSKYEDDPFFDALDEFPFYDSEPGPVDSDADVSLDPKPLQETPSPANLRRRRSISHHIRNEMSGNDLKNLLVSTSSISSGNSVASRGRNQRSSGNSIESANFYVNLVSDSKESDPCPSTSLDTTQNNDTPNSTAALVPRNYRYSRNLKEMERGSEKFNVFNVQLNSDRANNSINDRTKEDSTVTTANNEKEVDGPVSVDSRLGEADDSSSSFLLLLAGFVIKIIGFQINLLVSVFSFPIKLTYYSYMFVVDPFWITRRCRDCLMGMLLRLWGAAFETVSAFIYDWFKERKSVWKTALRCGWGLLWSVYVCFVLGGLLLSAFLVSGLVMSYIVEKPVSMKENLNFDYTKNSPTAYVPIISCPDVSCGVNVGGKIEVVRSEGPRVIPPDHKLQVTVSLIMPESDYNRDLGMFQVRVDFLSANGDVLASSSRPCMLHFKSQPLRLLLTFMKIAPLAAGYSSESQALNVRLRGFNAGDTLACLRVMIEQRAGFQSGAGVPEIYDASLTLESQLPLLKWILWSWKTTLFIWVSMMIFTMELLFALLCCKPIIMPSIRLRNGSPNSSAPPNSSEVQR